MIIRAGRPALLFGPVAQLGERTVRIRKVVGSNPFRSTKKEEHCFAVLFFFGIRGTFDSTGTNELPLCQGFRAAKTLAARHSARGSVSPPQAAQPKGDLKCSGEVKHALRQDFADAKCLHGAKAPVSLSARHFAQRKRLPRATRRVDWFRRRRRLNPRVI